MSSLAFPRQAKRSLIRPLVWLGGGVLLALVIDWSSKALVRHGGTFFVENPYTRSLWGIFVIAGLAGFLLWLVRSRIVALGLGIAVGAALGNMLELAFWGRATDWIPAFGGHANLADLMILVVPPITLAFYLYYYRAFYGLRAMWKGMVWAGIMLVACTLKLIYLSDRIGQPMLGGIFSS